jgi:hypothetical protein
MGWGDIDPSGPMIAVLIVARRFDFQGPVITELRPLSPIKGDRLRIYDPLYPPFGRIRNLLAGGKMRRDSSACYLKYIPFRRELNPEL